MFRVCCTVALLGLLVTSTPRYAAAQAGTNGQSNPFEGSVPTGTITPTPLSLSLPTAIARGLATNLGVLTSAEGVRESRARWLTALSNLLPNVTAQISVVREQVAVAETGFNNLPVAGVLLPPVIGPFSYIDARAYLSQWIFNWSDFKSTQSAAASRTASEYSYQAARELVVQAVVNAYLLAVADGALIDTTRAQVETARALYQQATDHNKAGVVASIDVLRARVQLQSEEQALIAAENQLAIDKLTLARVIGLPAGQMFSLADSVPYSELTQLTMDEALSRAYASRADYKSSQAQVRAAELARESAVAQNYPSASVDMNYGAAGTIVANSNGVGYIAGTVSIPIFQGTTVRAQVLQADAALKLSRDQLADLGGRIDFEVRSAFLNMTSSKELVAVARSSVELASQTLEQARDRFAAGIVDNLEVVQAQETVAESNQSYVSSLYAYNSAKMALARAMGVAEQSALTFLGVK